MNVKGCASYVSLQGRCKSAAGFRLVDPQGRTLDTYCSKHVPRGTVASVPAYGCARVRVLPLRKLADVRKAVSELVKEGQL